MRPSQLKEPMKDEKHLNRYLQILRKATSTPEIQDRIEAKNTTVQARSSFLTELQEIGARISDLTQKRSEALDKSVEIGATKPLVEEIQNVEGELEILQRLHAQIAPRQPEIEANVTRAREKIFQSAYRVFKKIQLEEQARLDDMFLQLADRIKAWDLALSQVGMELEAYHNIFYMSQNSSLSIKLLLKIFRI